MPPVHCSSCNARVVKVHPRACNSSKPLRLSTSARAIRVTRIEIATALIRRASDVNSRSHRDALAAYLQRLRRVSHPNVEIELAAQAGERLPDSHGLRLLRWAKRRLETRGPSAADEHQ